MHFRPRRPGDRRPRRPTGHRRPQQTPQKSRRDGSRRGSAVSPAITQLSPTGRALPDLKTLTCGFVPERKGLDADGVHRCLTHPPDPLICHEMPHRRGGPGGPLLRSGTAGPCRREPRYTFSGMYSWPCRQGALRARALPQSLRATPSSSSDSTAAPAAPARHVRRCLDVTVAEVALFGEGTVPAAR